ncbi:YhgE/Pip family protein [Agromyces aurantiacus]|uniref:YhgE/Pip family protein n=1 Tax=Agromyces aurantiacus TaxID=165814 RepID=A0ABV9R8R5_9MICO|nr:YhgE/Pip domain-containing protein [Agromyces aurantiacus]MBM7505135.1 putative membrane protein [Agromyces aurantiacus]
MTRTDPTAVRRRGRRVALLAVVAAVPIAVAGLVAGAIGGADDRFDAIPAIVVNNDEMVTITTPDGEEQPVLAGRQLVTELTGDGDTGFDWTISNDEEAAKALAAGDAYAVLTIPSDFSASVTSLSGDAPTTANLDIRTDDAHGYLAGVVGGTVGDAIASAFGHELTTQYLEGLYGNLITVGGSLGDAADGAGRLADGAGSLSNGLDQLAGGIGSAADGTSEAANGAAAYAAGVDQYTSGVEQLAGGVATLDTEAGGLDGITSGVAQYVGGVAQAGSGVDDGIAQYVAGVRSAGSGVDAGIASYVDGIGIAGDGVVAGTSGYVDGIDQLAASGDQLAASVPALLAADPSGAALQAAIQQYAAGVHAAADGGDDLVAGTDSTFDQLVAGGDQLQAGTADGFAKLAAGGDALRTGTATGFDELAAGGAALVSGTGSGIDGLQSGISQLSDGANAAAAGSPQLRDGASGLASGVSGIASGLTQLESGASASADGASDLAGGTQDLADGLAKGAEGTSSLEDMDPEQTAGVVADPVVSESTRDHEISNVGQVVAMLLAPIGLWLGAMALFLVFRPFSREALESTAPTGRLVGRTLFRGSLVGLVQAAAVVLLMHTALGVDWALLPQTLAFSALLAVAFTAIHAFLTAWLGRAGTIVSLVLVVLQLAASGGLYPLEIVSGPYQAISPFLPLTWAVQGMQHIVSGAGGSTVWASAGVIALFGVLGAVGTAIVVARRRAIRPAGRLAPAVA